MSLFGNVVGGVFGFMAGGPVGAVVGSVAAGAIDDAGILRKVERICPHCGSVYSWRASAYNSQLVGKSIMCSTCGRRFSLGNDLG